MYIFERTEKIATAIAMISDLLSETDAIVVEIKSVNQTLIACVARFASYESESDKRELKRILLHLSALTSILAGAKKISHMNAELIKHAIVGLLTHIDTQAHTALGADYFDRQTFTFEQQGQNDYKGQSLTKDISQRTNQYKSVQKTNTNSVSDKDESNGQKINTRRSTILNVIKDKGNVSIKDISLIVKDCSEKTIQRELSTLMSLGMVERKGERRWSTYSII